MLSVPYMTDQLLVQAGKLLSLPVWGGGRRLLWGCEPAKWKVLPVCAPLA